MNDMISKYYYKYHQQMVSFFDQNLLITKIESILPLSG